MIDTNDPSAVAEEWRMWVDFRRKHTRRIAEIVQRYVGNWYRDDLICDPTPENLLASWVHLMEPILASMPPRPRWTARRPITQGEIARWMQMGLRQWLNDFPFEVEQADTARDFLLGYAVMQVGLEPRDVSAAGENFELGGALWPFCQRVPNDMFAMDASCETPETSMGMGHEYWRDYNRMLENPERWDPAALEKLQPEPGRDEAGEASVRQGERPLRQGDAMPRGRIRCVDMWFRETQELITLASSADDVTNAIIRKVRFKGPRTGPYQVFGCHRIPGDPYPASPIIFWMEQFEELNSHLTATAEAASTYKRIVVVDGTGTDLKDGILHCTNGQVLIIPGLAGKSWAQIEIGGPNSEQIQYTGLVRERADRIAGISDAQRGRSAGVTATEATATESHFETRANWLKQWFAYGLKEVYKKVSWYLFYDPAVVMDVTDTDPMTGQIFEGRFLGGRDETQQHLELTQFDLEIDADGMSQRSQAEQLQQAMLLLQVGPQILQLMMAYPALNVRFILERIGDAMNIADLPDLLISSQILQQMGQAASQQMQFGGKGQPLEVAGAREGLYKLGLLTPPQVANGPPGAAGGMQSGMGGLAGRLGGMGNLGGGVGGGGNGRGMNPGFGMRQPVGQMQPA